MNAKSSTLDLNRKLRQARQDYPFFGTKEACDSVTLAQGWTVVDIDGMNLRIHDGVTKGGHKIPNLSAIIGLLGAGPIFGTLAEILEIEPTPGLIGVTTDTTGILVGGAGSWGGNIGVFATEADLAAVPCTNMAAGTAASVLDVGFAQLSSTKTKWLFAFTAEMP